MDANRIDALLVVFASTLSRRATLRSVMGLGCASLANPADARGKKQRRKKTCARAGQRLKRKRRRCCAGLAPDARKICQGQAGCIRRTCPPGACGSLEDGCGGTLSCGTCPAGQICLRGNTCQPCTIACTGSPTQCGAILQDALQSGGTWYVCPGRYQGGFVLGNDAVTLIGAGDGDDPASNTLLDGAFAGRVLDIPPGAGALTLERLRIGAGRAAGGGGIRLQAASSLQMTDCTVLGNVSDGGDGGGIMVDAPGTLEMTRCTIAVNTVPVPGSHVGGGIWTAGTTTLTDCVVENNNAPGGGGMYVKAGRATLAGSTRVRGNTATTSGVAWGGGGLYVNTAVSSDPSDNATVLIAETCRVTDNRAAPDEGGGIRGSTNVRLAGADPSPIVLNNCHDNCAGSIPKCAQVPVSCPA